MATADEIRMYFHCRKCVESRQTERLEAGLTETGLRVDCRKHGLVGHFTPERLAELIADRPGCDCCPGGKHLN